MISADMTRPHLLNAAFFLLWICGVADIDPPHPSPLPQGGEGEGSRSRCFSKAQFSSRFQIGGCSEPAFDSKRSGRRNSSIHLGRLPLPPGGPTFREGWGEGKAVYLLGCLACSSLAAAKCFSRAGSIFCANAFNSGAPLTLSSVTVLACFLNSSMVSSCAFT